MGLSRKGEPRVFLPRCEERVRKKAAMPAEGGQLNAGISGPIPARNPAKGNLTLSGRMTI